MQVFKLFFQVIKKNKITVFITLFITFAFAIVFVKNNGDAFVVEKVKIAIIDLDKTESSKELTKYLENYTTVKDIAEKDIEDALFYRDVEYVLYIPNDYERSIKTNKEITLEKKMIPDSVSAYLIDSYIDSFTNTVRGYYAHANIETISDAINLAEKDLALTIESTSIFEKTKESVNVYFNFLCYSFFCSIIWAVGILMISLNDIDIKRRNVVSPMSSVKMNLLLSISVFVFGIFLFIIGTVFAYIVFPDGMNEVGSYLYLLNLVALLVPCLGLSYLIGNAIKKVEAISGVSNILCLGLAFLGGCFVPQSLLSESVLKISKFTPSYWFVNSNDKIFNLVNTDIKYIEPILKNMFILILFGIVYFGLALIISKKNRKNII